MKVSNILNLSLSLLFIILLSASVSSIIDNLMPKFFDKLVENNMDGKIKLFLEICINLMLIYGFVVLYNRHLKEVFINIFGLNQISKEYLFFMNELFVFIFMVITNKGFISKIKYFTSINL
jgi:hypothetical protein